MIFERQYRFYNLVAVTNLVLVVYLAVFASTATAVDGPQASAQPQDDWIYTIRPNDTLWALCKNYSNEPGCWQKLVRYNQIKTPKYLPPGTRIKIPRRWLKTWRSTAKAVSVQGEVNKLSSDAQQLSPLIVGDELSKQDEVRSEAGTATLEFSDGSQLYLQNHTRIALENLQYHPNGKISNTRVYA